MFTSLGDRGGGSIKAVGTTISQSPSSTIPVGSLLAVFVAWDNNNQNSGDGPLSTQIGCSDSVGNIYLEMYSGQATGANARAHGSIFLTYVTTPITTGDTVTVTNGTSAKLAKAMSLWEFGIDDGYLPATTDAGPQQRTTNGADPAAIAIGSVVGPGTGMDTEREYLLLHVLAAEGPSSDTYTWDSDYTRIVSHGTSGGVDNTNMTVNGGFRIATLTGDTVDVTALTSPFRDYTQGLQAVWGYKPEATFPTTPILDNFNRADEDPLTTPPWNGSAASGSRKLQVISNTAARSDIGLGGGGGQWWGEFFAANDQEVFATISTIPAEAGEIAAVAANGNGDHDSLRGGLSMLSWQPGGAVMTSARIHYGALGFTGLPSPLYGIAYRRMADGNKIGIRRTGSVQEYWISEGSGWFMLVAVDRGAGGGPGDGFIGLICSATTVRLDDFGGGARPRGRVYGYILD